MVQIRNYSLYYNPHSEKEEQLIYMKRNVCLHEMFYVVGSVNILPGLSNICTIAN